MSCRSQKMLQTRDGWNARSTMKRSRLVSTRGDESLARRWTGYPNLVRSSLKASSEKRVSSRASRMRQGNFASSDLRAKRSSFPSRFRFRSLTAKALNRARKLLGDRL
jgi:hypothetical protein